MTTLNPEEKKLSLRVLIDRKGNKVLFAEACSDFVDVLFSFMTLPLGTIVRLLDKHVGPQKESVGSLKTLRDSVEKLSSRYFWTEEAKLMLVNPMNSSETECQKLKMNMDDSETTKYFVCEDWKCIIGSHSLGISTYSVTRCSRCGKFMNREIGLKASTARPDSSSEGGFTCERVNFIISDDLHVSTNLAGSSFQLLNGLGIKDMTAIEERTCILGLKEMINLLKCSIVSNTPFSDVVLHNEVHKSEKFCSVLSQTIQENSTSNSSEMVLKAMVYKSTKVLFAQVEEDFINFLFSLLTIPLGRVLSLLSDDTSLGSIVNLYKSISSLKPSQYLKSEELSSMLLNPNLPPQYLCKHHIFDLSEKSSPDLICTIYMESEKHEVSLNHRPSWFTPTICDGNIFTSSTTLSDPKGGKLEFVRGPSIFMVTDDLEVTPMSSMSGISFVNRLGIPFCDVKELELKIGIKEALGILRASLSSSSALTNGLNLASKKQAKQEN